MALTTKGLKKAKSYKGLGGIKSVTKTTGGKLGGLKAATKAGVKLGGVKTATNKTVKGGKIGGIMGKGKAPGGSGSVAGSMGTKQKIQTTQVKSKLPGKTAVKSQQKGDVNLGALKRPNLAQKKRLIANKKKRLATQRKHKLANQKKLAARKRGRGGMKRRK